MSNAFQSRPDVLPEKKLPGDDTATIPVTITQTWHHSARTCEIVVTNDETGKSLPFVTRVELDPKTKTARVYIANQRGENWTPVGNVWPDYRAVILLEGGQA